MKIAAGVNFIHNGARISEYFSKAENFFIYDLENGELIHKLTNHIRNSHGSEVFCAQMLIKRGVNIVVCGTCEDNAKKLFDEANIQVVENVDANPAEYIEEIYLQHKKDELIFKN